MKKKVKDLTFKERLEYLDWYVQKCFSREENVICPYCGYEHDPDDAFKSEKIKEMQCDMCRKIFEYAGDTEWVFSSFQKNTEVEDWLKEKECAKNDQKG